MKQSLWNGGGSQLIGGRAGIQIPAAYPERPRAQPSPSTVALADLQAVFGLF